MLRCLKILGFNDNRIRNKRAFCVEAKQPQILVVDTTFRVAEQFATFTNSRHHILRTKNTDVMPVFVGFVMFDQHPPSDNGYHYLASAIARTLGVSSGSLHFLGSDGDCISFIRLGCDMIFPPNANFSGTV